MRLACLVVIVSAVEVIDRYVIKRPGVDVTLRAFFYGLAHRPLVFA